MHATVGSRFALPLQRLAHRVKRDRLSSNHLEDAADDAHLLLVNEIPGPLGVEVESVARARRGRQKLPLLELANLAPPRTLGYLRALVLGKLVEDAVRELALWTPVPLIA